jgi:hypothetical protein
MFQPRTERLGDAYADQMACLNKANNSLQVVAMDKVISDLNTGWRPTGYYAPDDLQAVIAVLEDSAEKVGKAIAAAPIPWFSPDAESMKREAFNDILAKWRDRGAYFKQELAKARAAGAKVINAPGAKDWVISSMRAMSDGYTTAAMLSCQTSSFQSIVEGGYRVMAKIGEVVWGVGSTVVNVAEGVWDASKDAFRVVGFLLKFLPYAAIGLGGYLAFVYGRAGYRRLVTRAEGPINWGKLFRRKPRQISGARRRRRR